MIKYLAVHHFGSPATSPLSSTKNLTEKELDKLHKERWSDFPSKFNNSYIGYNIVIYPNGEYKQYRFIGEETAAQKGHNLDTISVCLAGNFTKGADIPTLSQIASLKKIMRACVYGRPEDVGLSVLHNTPISISKDRVVPHRVLQPNHTACYGSFLSDTWASNLLDVINTEEEKTTIAYLTQIVKRLIEQLSAIKRKPLSGLLHHCWDNARG